MNGCMASLSNSFLNGGKYVHGSLVCVAISFLFALTLRDFPLFISYTGFHKTKKCLFISKKA